MRSGHRRRLARAAALAVSAAFVIVGVSGAPVAGEEPPPNPPETTPIAPTTTVPTSEPPAPSDHSEETGEVDGVDVAVGLPPMPPLTPSAEVGEVDGVEVAVAAPPVPPTTEVSVAPTTVTPSRMNGAPQRVDAVLAAQQLIESMQTIDVLLDAWS